GAHAERFRASASDAARRRTDLRHPPAPVRQLLRRVRRRRGRVRLVQTVRTGSAPAADRGAGRRGARRWPLGGAAGPARPRSLARPRPGGALPPAAVTVEARTVTAS